MTVNLTQIFNLIFLSILGLTVLSQIIAVFLSLKKNVSPQQMHMLEACITTWKMGFGAVIGMLVGFIK